LSLGGGWNALTGALAGKTKLDQNRGPQERSCGPFLFGFGRRKREGRGGAVQWRHSLLPEDP